MLSPKAKRRRAERQRRRRAEERRRIAEEWLRAEERRRSEARDQFYRIIPEKETAQPEEVLLRIHAYLYCGKSWPRPDFDLFLDSVEDIMEVLVYVMNSKTTSKLACDVAMKMVQMLPPSRIRSAFVLLNPLVHLLRGYEHKASTSFADTISNMIRKSSSRKDQQLLQILEEGKAVRRLVRNIREFGFDNHESKYFRSMADLLQSMLLRWPCYRLRVWNDRAFLKVLEKAKDKSNIHMRDGALGLYSGLALCGNWVDRLLTSGNELLRVIVQCMHPRQPSHLRIECFMLARRLAVRRASCVQMLKMCFEPLLKSVIAALENWNELSRKQDKAEARVARDVCCLLACITSQASDHHDYFWKEGLDKVLLNTILDDYETNVGSAIHLKFNALKRLVRRDFHRSSKCSVRSYVWDVVGALVANCDENFKRESIQKEFQHKVMILCLCFAFTKGDSEAAGRALSMVANSKSRYIASMARLILPRVLTESVSLEKSLETLKNRVRGNGVPSDLDTVLSLLNLACQSRYREPITQQEVVATLKSFIGWWLKNPVRIKRESISPHLQFYIKERFCCLHSTEEWEGEDTCLVFSLWTLAELLHQTTLVNSCEDPIVYELQEVCVDSKLCSGSRWYAAYILSWHSFRSPDKMGRRKCRKLEYLLQLANEGVPKWGTPMPRFDLAFLSAELDSKKIVVKSNETKSGSWNCESCSKSVPHLHVPKDVLKLSSDYFVNLFGSCMKDSCLKTSTAYVSWEALEKLGPWLYLEPLPSPNLGCLCANMDPAEKLKEVGVYLQLCCLAEYWGSDDLYEESYRIVVSCLNVYRNMPAKIIEIADDLNLNNLVQLAADYLAPRYHQLMDSGEFVDLDDDLVGKVRIASERLTPEAMIDQSSSSSSSERSRYKGTIQKPR